MLILLFSCPALGFPPKEIKNEIIANIFRGSSAVFCWGIEKDLPVYPSNSYSPYPHISLCPAGDLLTGKRQTYMPTRMAASSFVGERIQLKNTSHAC